MAGWFASGARLVMGSSRSLGLGLGLAALALTTSGCADKKDGAAADEANFSILPVDSFSSILPALESSEGQIDVCVGLIGYPAAERQATIDRLTRQVTDAANQWNALLDGNPSWTLRHRIDPSYFVQDSECTQTNFAGFSVNVWKNADQFKREFCARVGLDLTTRCSAAALSNRRTFYLGPWNRTREVDALDFFTTLHEYGHLLGLGDTYRIPGLHDFVGEQPASVMNGEAFFLTDDDKLGLWATLRAVKTGRRSCEGFGDKVIQTANGFAAVMCNPDSQPIDNHGPGGGEVLPPPPIGPIPDSTLREIDTYEAASIQLNCRAGAGTEHPVVHRVVQGTPLRALDGGFFQPRIAFSTEGRPWILVNAEGRTCYTSANFQFIKPVGAIPLATLREVDNYAVSTQLLNCRSGAGTEHAVIQTLPLSTKLVADRGSSFQPRLAFSIEGNPWILVRANNQTCYASGNFKFIFPQ